MHAIHYHAPDTLADAIALLAQDAVRSRYLAGGTDLFLALEHQLRDVHTVIDLKRIGELHGIGAAAGEGGGKGAKRDGRARDGGDARAGWRIGALTCMAEIEHHAGLQRHVPALCAAAAVVGGPPIRNRATLGGNLCNASPAADTATPLLALGAQAVLAEGKRTRSIPLAELWKGPRRTTLPPGAVLEAVTLPAPAARTGNAFQRLTRSAMDIALVNAAAQVTLDEAGRAVAVTVALGAVGPTVLLVPGLDGALMGRPLDAAALDEVRRRAEAAARPIDDVRASAAYRAEMAGVLAARAVREAAARAAGGAR